MGTGRQSARWSVVPRADWRARGHVWASRSHLVKPLGCRARAPWGPSLWRTEVADVGPCGARTRPHLVDEGRRARAHVSGLRVRPPAGTTAHVGIMLYGAEGRSGHRHLDGDRAFRRNSLDVFQIATPHSLGSVRKIRVWHDNKGLWGRLWPPRRHPASALPPDSAPPPLRAQPRLVPAARHRQGPAERPQHLLPGQRLALGGDRGQWRPRGEGRAGSK